MSAPLHAGWHMVHVDPGWPASAFRARSRLPFAWVRVESSFGVVFSLLDAQRVRIAFSR